jgi:adenylate kinase family enzyme
MEAYESLTRPLTDYYRQSGKLLTIPADGDPNTILERTLTQLIQRA